MAFKTQLGIVYTQAPAATWSARDGSPGQGAEHSRKPGQKAPAVLSPSVRTTYLSDLRAQG